VPLIEQPFYSLHFGDFEHALCGRSTKQKKSELKMIVLLIILAMILAMILLMILRANLARSSSMNCI
jgi:hypothetical protein